MTDEEAVDARRQLSAQRRCLVRPLSVLLDRPMTVLAFVWLGLRTKGRTCGETG